MLHQSEDEDAMIALQIFAIPAEDLTRQFAEIDDELRAALEPVRPGGRDTPGSQLAAFEEDFAAFCGTRYAVGTSRGTDALHLALLACGIGPGDKAITTPNTSIATACAISYVGATPVFIDAEPLTGNMHPDLLEAAITGRTRTMLAVHLYGQVCEMEPIVHIARRYGLKIIEDAAHAQGALYHGRAAGSWGDVACFSFYPTKTPGALGDAGALSTNDPAIDQRLRQLRSMGQRVKHTIMGYQKRMDEVRAARLRVKLRHLPTWIAWRQAIASQYHRQLAGLPTQAQERTYVYYLYTIQIAHRDQLKTYLSKQGIGLQVIYPMLIPDQQAYQHQPFHSHAIPVARRLVEQILCLPLFLELRVREIEQIVAAIHALYHHE
ncbi:MAG TPA: DegT/DnrJ/EryC1/StrS family aminotransferase [Ktedonobacteraceae bacterium]